VTAAVDLRHACAHCGAYTARTDGRGGRMCAAGAAERERARDRAKKAAKYAAVKLPCEYCNRPTAHREGDAALCAPRDHRGGCARARPPALNPRWRRVAQASRVARVPALRVWGYVALQGWGLDEAIEAVGDALDRERQARRTTGKAARRRAA